MPTIMGKRITPKSLVYPSINEEISIIEVSIITKITIAENNGVRGIRNQI